MRVAVVGSGRVAEGLAPWLDRQDKVVAVISRSKEKALRLTAFLPSAQALTWDESFPTVDWWFLAVKDDVIPAVDDLLAQKGAYRGAQLATHTSGAHPAHALQKAHEQKIPVASVHPLYPFASDERLTLQEVFFALEGDDEAIQVVEAWLDHWQAPHRRLRTEQKPLYHAAAVLASNSMVTLLGAAESLLRKLDLPVEEVFPPLTHLSETAIRQARRLGPAAALTGPIQRGEVTTIQAHLRALTGQAPELLPLYRTLAQATLPLARQRGAAPPEALEAISKLLDTSLGKGALP
ncbi:MAG: DUF2520 domain-containing protein [Bacillota bacterium]|nr:DUF2520 domain-containing protein [Bacillota bacterium]